MTDPCGVAFSFSLEQLVQFDSAQAITTWDRNFVPGELIRASYHGRHGEEGTQLDTGCAFLKFQRVRVQFTEFADRAHFRIIPSEASQNQLLGVSTVTVAVDDVTLYAIDLVSVRVYRS